MGRHHFSTEWAGEYPWFSYSGSRCHAHDAKLVCRVFVVCGKFENQFLYFLAARIGETRGLAYQPEPTFLQNANRADVVFGRTGIHGRLVSTSARKVLSAQVAMPWPQSACPIQ